MIQFIFSNFELAFLFLLLVFSFFIYWCIDEKSGLQLCIITLLSIWFILAYQQISAENNFPLSLRLSWVIIAVIFTAFLFLHKKLEELFKKGSFRAYMITAAIVSFLLILYRPIFYFVIPGGILLGMSLGYCLNKKYIGFKSKDYLEMKGYKKIIILFARFFIGLAVLALIIYRILIILQHVTENQNIFLYLFLCCTLLSLWVSVAAPWIFIKLRLTGSNIEK